MQAHQTFSARDYALSLLGGPRRSVSRSPTPNTLPARLLPTAFTNAISEIRLLGAGPRIAWFAHVVKRMLGISRAGQLPTHLPPDALVVFVGWGDDCLGPIAAALLTREAGRAELSIRTASAGLRGPAGVPPTEVARSIAAEHGLSLESHRPESFTPELVAAADLLVTVDRPTAAMVASQLPAAAQKLVLLGDFDAEDDLEVAAIPGTRDLGIDPARGRVQRFERGLRGLVQVLAQTHSGRARPVRSGAKAAVRRMLASPTLRRLWSPLSGDAATIFMLHRFEDREAGVQGHDPTALAVRLEYLRRHRFNITSLRELVTRLSAGEPMLPHTVVFTVDDGYADFARVGAPVFARYDCPATLFAVTAFVDGEQWLWYDTIGFFVGGEPHGDLTIEIGGSLTRIQWHSAAERQQQVLRLTECLKGVPSPVLEQALSSLAAASGRALPTRPTAQYAPMTWDDARYWSERGMEFGPHSHTHPILARTDARRSSMEIRRSWSRILTELPLAVPVFCYPNGMQEDFTDREQGLVRGAGFLGAVRADGGYCTLRRFKRDRFAIPRIPYDTDPLGFRQVVNGVERVKQLARGSYRP